MKCLRQYADESQMWAAIENDDKLRKKVLTGMKGCDETTLAADHLASLPRQFNSSQSRQITLSYSSYDLYPRADYVQRFGEPSSEDELQWNGEPYVKKVATEWNVPCLGLQIVACWRHRFGDCNLFGKEVATKIQHCYLARPGAVRASFQQSQSRSLEQTEHGDGLAAFLWSHAANSASSVTDALEDSSSLTLFCHAVSLRRKFRTQTSDNMDR